MASGRSGTNPPLVADTPADFEIQYNGVSCTLKIDGVLGITVSPAGGIDYTGEIPTIVYWGQNSTGSANSDAVFK